MARETSVVEVVEPQQIAPEDGSGPGAAGDVGRGRSAAVAASPAELPSAALLEGALAGHLAGVDDEGRLLFQPEGSSETVSVSIGLAMSDEELLQAAWTGRRALVVRTAGRPAHAVLVALVRERISREARQAFPSGLNVRVDGDTVRVAAGKELELRCGKARILLRRDGRIEASGTHLIQRSRGPVKIKGATVELN